MARSRADTIDALAPPPPPCLSVPALELQPAMEPPRPLLFPPPLPLRDVHPLPSRRPPPPLVMKWPLPVVPEVDDVRGASSSLQPLRMSVTWTTSPVGPTISRCNNKGRESGKEEARLIVGKARWSNRKCSGRLRIAEKYCRHQDRQQQHPIEHKLLLPTQAVPVHKVYVYRKVYLRHPRSRYLSMVPTGAKINQPINPCVSRPWHPASALRRPRLRRSPSGPATRHRLRRRPTALSHRE